MKVLVQRINKHGRRPIRAAVVHLNDGPDSFEGQGGSVDIELVQHCLREGLDISDETELNSLVNQDEGVMTNWRFSNVQLSLNDDIYTLTRIDDGDDE